MGRRYYCHYCDRSFIDELQARKRHLSSISHKNFTKAFYKSLRDTDAFEKFLENELSKEECYAFLKKGICNFGDNCYRSHYSRAQLELMKNQDTEIKRLAIQEKLSMIPSMHTWKLMKTKNPFYKMLTNEEFADLLKLPCTFPLPQSLQQFSSFGQDADIDLDTWG